MAYLYTASVVFRQQMSGGLRQLLLRILLAVAYMVPLMLLWRTLLGGNAAQQAGATLAQMMTYAYMNMLLSEQLNVRTSVADTFYEGSIVGLCQRPLGIFRQITAETIGSWLPRLLFVSLPMALCAPFLRISLQPATWWALPSLLLAVSLGFAVDYLFASLMIHMRNAIWMVYSIRTALTTLFSGALIPFALLPWGLGRLFTLLPFGSMAGAPLALYTGLSSPVDILPLQLFWNILLWPLAVWAFRQSRERMVSFGG